MRIYVEGTPPVVLAKGETAMLGPTGWVKTKSLLDLVVDDAEAAKARGDWRLYGQLAAVAGAILAGRAEPVRR